LIPDADIARVNRESEFQALGNVVAAAVRTGGSLAPWLRHRDAFANLFG
jgi:hypothetical protein